MSRAKTVLKVEFEKLLRDNSVYT